jgi:hypothetical protein
VRAADDSKKLELLKLIILSACKYNGHAFKPIIKRQPMRSLLLQVEMLLSIIQELRLLQELQQMLE